MDQQHKKPITRILARELNKAEVVSVSGGMAAGDTTGTSHISSFTETLTEDGSTFQNGHSTHTETFEV